ncbi:hypothetical protein CLU96_2196 [Chryseobacterium sp. 52]|nr:hypothetical protein CLU96_2196 [Chryseobacterium sp. 52]
MFINNRIFYNELGRAKLKDEDFWLADNKVVVISDHGTV